MVAAASLALPSEEDLAGDTALRVGDEPAVAPAAIDVDVAIEAALARADAFDAAVWDIDVVAASLDGDPEAAFRFVRDRIGFDAYPGVLRCAEGTLAARSGNAFDRALLLHALLTGGRSHAGDRSTRSSGASRTR